MSGFYYYRFEDERQIGSWQEVSRSDLCITIACEFECSPGRFLLLWAKKRNPQDPVPEVLCVNGLDCSKLEDFYLRRGGTRRGIPLELKNGSNRIVATLSPGQYDVN